MIKSYDEIYLEETCDNIATMLDGAVLSGIQPEEFWRLFISSNVARNIENGHPRYLVGMSGIELLNELLNEQIFLNDKKIFLNPEFNTFRSEYYWAGWVLAQYQNYKNISFYELNKLFPIEKVLSLYDILHEADITKFFSIVDEHIENSQKNTKLKQYRKLLGLSQKELSEKAKVSIRNIQMYEQRQNDINKAQIDTVYRLSKVLHCKIEDLMEI